MEGATAQNAPASPTQQDQWFAGGSGAASEPVESAAAEPQGSPEFNDADSPEFSPTVAPLFDWLNAEQPHRVFPTELFSERLGPKPAHLGPGRASDEMALPWRRPRTVALGHIMRRDVALSRRGVLGAEVALATGSALIEPVLHWLTARPDPTPELTPGYLDDYEMSQLENATRVFRDCAERRAGGLRRQAVVGQLCEITELLENSYPDDITRRLYSTVAELAALAGSMAHEEGLDATAQKYFVLALRATKQARDGALGGEILSRMAQQMVHLGYPRDALALIDCAWQGSRDTASASLRSLFLLVEAWSYAHLGQAETCHRAVGAAQSAFADSRPGEDPPWLAFGTADVIGMAGHAYRILSEHDPNQTVHAEPLIRQALALRDPENVRDRALDLIDLAVTYLLQSDLDGACAASEEALALVDQVRFSAHVLAEMRSLQTQAERYGSAPARRLAARLRDVLSPTYDGGYLGETTTASIPGPAWAPTTAPTSLR